MLYEFAITPDLFDASVLSMEDRRAEVILPQILDGILKNGGLLANLNKDKWRKHIEERTETLVADFPNLRGDILTLINTLYDRKRLIRHPKRGCPSTDQEWLNLILKSHDEIPFHAIILSQGLIDGCESKRDEFVELFNSLDSNQWNSRRRTLSVRKTSDDYERHLAPLLRYARKLVLIDPYLKPEEHLTTINICSELLGKRRRTQERFRDCRICIHAEDGKGVGYEGVDDYFDSWEKELRPLIKKYGHRFSIFLWKSSKKMHDRFILTDQWCGISVPRGLACLEKPQEDVDTDWLLLDEETWEKRSYQYDPDIHSKSLLKSRKFPED